MDEGIGNLLALTPALRVIKEYDSSTHITVFCKHVVVDLIKDSKFVDKVISVPNDDSYDIGFFALWFEGYAAVFIDRLAHQCKEVYSIELQTQGVPEYMQYMEIPKLLGCDVSSIIPKPFVGLPFDFDQPTIALCDTCAPAEAWQRKRWPYYPELAHKLVDDGFQVLIIGADSDRKAFMGNFNDQIIDCIGKFSLRELKFVFQHCQLVIGNDGGIPKLACAMRIPTIFIFGSTYIPKNYPIGENFRVIYLPLDCSPCQYSERWSSCQDFKCMNLLDVVNVYEVTKEIINESSNSCNTSQN
jgi:ADP-heptose:LPS heptosyltransferase